MSAMTMSCWAFVLLLQLVARYNSFLRSKGALAVRMFFVHHKKYFRARSFHAFSCQSQFWMIVRPLHRRMYHLSLYLEVLSSCIMRCSSVGAAPMSSHSVIIFRMFLWWKVGSLVDRSAQFSNPIICLLRFQCALAEYLAFDSAVLPLFLPLVRPVVLRNSFFQGEHMIVNMFFCISPDLTLNLVFDVWHDLTA